MNTIFISHLTKEKELSFLLENALEDEFYPIVKIFNSSGTKSIRTGQNFILQIDQALKECKYALFLVGPDSVNAKWINLEFGAIAMRNLNLSLEEHIPMAPICHSGLTVGTLGKPLDSKIAKIAGDETQLKELFTDIADAIGWKKAIRPKKDLTEMIRKFENDYFLNKERKKYIQELQHINLPVSKLERSIEFYADLLGLQLSERPPFQFGGAWFILPNGQHIHLVEHDTFELLKYKLPIHGEVKSPPDIHFALRVDHEKFPAFVAKVTGNLPKDQFINQPFPNIPMSQLYLLDPDGYVIEITDIQEDQKHPKYIDRNDWYRYAYGWK